MKTDYPLNDIECNYAMYCYEQAFCCNDLSILLYCIALQLKWNCVKPCTGWFSKQVSCNINTTNVNVPG